LDFAELGRASFDLLREQIGAAPVDRPRPGPELIIRESSGPRRRVAHDAPDALARSRAAKEQPAAQPIAVIANAFLIT
jgi:hypothetical protein